MKHKFGQLLDLLMGRGPVARLGRFWNRRRLVVLAYHGIDDRKEFAGHLDQLTKSYNVVTLDEVLDSLKGATLPDNSVLITFDDGERTVLTDGLPELSKRSLPAVLFAIADFVDSDRPFWWSEAEELVERGGRSQTLGDVNGAAAAVSSMKTIADEDRLKALTELRASAGGDQCKQGQLTSEELRHLDSNGMAVENHSWTHPLLDMCTDDKIEYEVGAAAERLEKILGRPLRAFAYPNGNVDPRVAETVRRRGNQVAFCFDHRIGSWAPTDPMLISRVRVNSTSSQNRFAAIVSGVHPAVHALRGGS